jgi:excisionase family DNA binding protein
MIDIEPSAAEDRPLTMAEVAQLVRLHPKAVVEYVRRGELVGQQIGRRWTFSQAAVDAFLEPMPDWTFEVQLPGMNGEVSSWIPPEIPQPSAKTLEAVDKLASYMKAKAAKNTPDPKEATGPRVRSDAGRFVGVRVNEEEVPRLPIFPAQWALEDPRKRPYLVVWGNGAHAIKMTPAEGGDAVVVTLTSSESYRIAIRRRALARGGTALFYLCPWCRKPRLFLYLQTLSGDELVEYLGPRCLRCAGLRFASQGRYRTKLTREFSPILGPRPRYPWDPWAVSDPRIAERATQNRQPRGESPEVSDDPEDPNDLDLA